jgi:hypothetical protein
MLLRSPSTPELMLLEYLISGIANWRPSEKMRENLKVGAMNDGRMGSLRLFPSGSEDQNAQFGKCASACHFTDEDGVEIIASLNLDQYGNLYELDLWKTDFGKLIRIPENKNELRRGGT